MIHSDLKPENVTEAAAAAYLTACGWWKVPDDSGDWMRSEPHLMRMKRGNAVLHEWKRDMTRVWFVMSHAKPELQIALLIRGIAACAYDFLKFNGKLDEAALRAKLDAIAKKPGDDLPN